MIPGNPIRSAAAQAPLSINDSNQTQTPVTASARVSQTVNSEMRAPNRSLAGLFASILKRLSCAMPPSLTEVLTDWINQGSGREKNDRAFVARHLIRQSAMLIYGTIYVNRNLDFSDRTNIRSLPDNLRVSGSLFLDGCRSLTSLPDNLQVQDLSLRGCSSLTSLPDKLKVGGDLDLSYCTNLNSLPNWITTIGPRADGETRHIHLTGTGLSQDILEQIRRADAPGIAFNFVHAAADFPKHQNLSDALQSWSIDVSTINTNQWQLTNHQLSQLTTYLNMLHNTAEAQNPNTRVSLQQLVQDSAARFNNADFRRHALSHIQNTLSSWMVR